MRRQSIVAGLMVLIAAISISALAQEPSKTTTASTASTPTEGASYSTGGAKTAGSISAEERMERLEGEKRFRTNCVRCHQPPHKFPPRVMAAAIRHMRVRAMLTDEDMRLILRYMTQ
jgi:mono/diheme cytochrome c family protein